MGTMKNFELRFGGATIPLKLLGNGHSSNKISFKNLHKEDEGKTGYKTYCKECGKIIEDKKKELTKGYKLGNEIIPISKKLIKEAKKQAGSKKAKVLDVKKNFDTIPKKLIDNTYPIKWQKGEDKEETRKNKVIYASLMEALSLSNITIMIEMPYSSKSWLVGIALDRNGVMVATKFKNPNFLRNFKEEIGELDVESNEKIVKKLINVLNSFNEFNFSSYEDEYVVRLDEIIKKKALGEEVEIEAEEKGDDFLEELEEYEEMKTEGESKEEQEDEKEKQKVKQKVIK